MVQAQIDAVVALARSVAADTPDVADLRVRLTSGLGALYTRWLQAHGCSDLPAALALLAPDLRLNADGLAHWLQSTGATKA